MVSASSLLDRDRVSAGGKASVALDALDYADEMAFNQTKWNDRLDQRN